MLPLSNEGELSHTQLECIEREQKIQTVESGIIRMDCLIYGFVARSLPQNTNIPIDIIKLCIKYYELEFEAITLEKELNKQKQYEQINVIYGDDKIGCLEGCKKTKHIRSILLTTFILFIVIWSLICYLLNYINTNHCPVVCNSKFFSSHYWCIPVSILYIIYINESLSSSTSHYLNNVYLPNTLSVYLDKIKSYKPSISCKMKCYHVIKNEGYDMNGNREITYVEITTLNKTKSIDYSEWHDLSDNIDNLNINNEIVKIKIDQLILFKDGATAKKCRQIMEDFKKKYMYYDLRYEYSQSWSIDTNYETKILLKTESYSVVISKWFYVMVSFCLCSSCYRTWLSSNAIRRRHKIIKQITI